MKHCSPKWGGGGVSRRRRHFFLYFLTPTVQTVVFYCPDGHFNHAPTGATYSRRSRTRAHYLQSGPSGNTDAIGNLKLPGVQRRHETRPSAGDFHCAEHSIRGRRKSLPRFHRGAVAHLPTERRETVQRGSGTEMTPPVCASVT